jgi:hypothetical protein
MTPLLTKRDTKTSSVIQSAISFGEYVNVVHAKDILAMLFLQVGSPIVALENGKLAPKLLSENDGDLRAPLFHGFFKSAEANIHMESCPPKFPR